MKIAIDARKWRDYGIGTYVRNLVRHLARLDSETTYFLFCNRGDEATLRDLAENFIPIVDDSRGYSLSEHVSIPMKLRRLGADLFHSPHYVVPLLCRTPSVVTIHDCIHLLFPQYLPNRMAWSYARFMMGSAIKRSAVVLTVSEASRRDILRFYPEADPERVQVVPNAIDPFVLDDPGKEETERVRERYQIQGRFVLYAGNIKPHKNLDRLIAAFGLLKQRPGHEDLKLLIIGDEVNRYGSLRRSVEGAGIRQDVRFFGFVPDRTLAALYRLADVFAFPSLYEGFGLPPLEAMACGTPVVTSRISSLPEVVGDAALLVDPYSVDDIALGLQRALGDQALRAELAIRGPARAQTFSWDRSVRAIHSVYMKALGLPAHRALATVLCALLFCAPRGASAADAPLKAGAAAVRITPFGENPDWKGPVTSSGVWGEAFQDLNKNGRWDDGEPFDADAANTALDPRSAGHYGGIYLAGFGNGRLATGMHDDLWARALVMEAGGQRVAFVSLDLIGYTVDGGYFGLDHARKLLEPALGVQEILLSCTHNHEGPDAIGLWGASATSDGKFPLYLQFVDQQIAKAITAAARSLSPVRLKLGVTYPKDSPSLVGMQTRTDGRPPRFFDDELRAAQFVATEDKRDKVVATLVNWNTHPESMEDENTILTSDFPAAVRSAIEARYGGTALYVSGDLGAVEIVGDSGRSTRNQFDGRIFPIVPKDKGASFTFARTEAIGRDVARAASEAIDKGQWSEVTTIDVRKADLRVPLDNQGYAFLIDKGVLSPPAAWNTPSGMQASTVIESVRFGDAQILTVPGELFPEVFYGVAQFRRDDCPAADTGRKPEPAIRPLMNAKYKFVFGLSPDELGYLVPGYDFRPPTLDPAAGLEQAADACQTKGVPTHYHETNSASSQLATAYACVAAELLSGQRVTQSPCKELAVRAPAR